MKRINVFSGGQPRKLDDLILIQDNVKELTSAIAKSIATNETAIILNGCEITVPVGGYYKVNPGAIWYQDEIYLVSDSGNIAIPGGETVDTITATYFWDLEVSNSRNESFKDGSSNQVEEYRKAKVIKTPTVWSGINYNLKRFEDIVLDLQLIPTKEVVTFTETQSGVFSLTSQSSNLVTDSKSLSNVLSGRVNLTCNVTNATINLQSNVDSVLTVDSRFFIPYISSTRGSSIAIAQCTAAFPFAIEIRDLVGTNFASGETISLHLNVSSVKP